MHRSGHVALRAGICVAVALSSVVAAYVLKQWLPHLWDHRNPAHGGPDDKPAHRPPKVDPPAPAADPRAPDPDPRATADQTRSLPPLRTHSLPPSVPIGHALFSAPPFAIDPGSGPSPAASVVSFHTSNGEEGVGHDGRSTSDPLEESFVDVLSPPPTNAISRRRSVRAHDLFAESHISFSELGSLVAPQEPSN